MPKGQPAFNFRGDFASALTKVASEPSFRDRLEKEPISALGELGIEISSSAKATLIGKRLSELIPVGPSRPGGEVAHVGVLVVVGVAIGTNLRVDELKDRIRYRKAVQERVREVIAAKGADRAAVAKRRAPRRRAPTR